MTCLPREIHRHSIWQAAWKLNLDHCLHPEVVHHRKCCKCTVMGKLAPPSAARWLSRLTSALGGGFCLQKASRVPLIYPTHSSADGKQVGAEEESSERADQTQLVCSDWLQGGLPQVRKLGAQVNFTMSGPRNKNGGSLLPGWKCACLWSCECFFV